MIAPTVKSQTIEEGNYLATLYKIVYMGTVEGEYKGEKTSAFKVNLTWELPTEMKVWKEGEEAKPVSVSKMYTLSVNKKSSLRPIIEGMVGGMTDAEAVNFDVDALLGKSCFLNITYGVSETGKERQNVSTALIPKGIPAPEHFNKPVILDYISKWNEEVFNTLPQFMRDEMSKTYEYQTMKGVGCEACYGLGYKGRVAVYEMMKMSDELKKVIFGGPTPIELKDAAIRLGMRTLRMNALLKLKMGLTTVEEVLDNTAPDKR